MNRHAQMFMMPMPIFLDEDDEPAEKVKCPKCKHLFVLPEEEGGFWSTTPGVSIFIGAIIIGVVWLVCTITFWFINGGTLIDVLRSQWTFITSLRIW